MKLGSAIAVYLLFWTLTLFVTLPLGVRTHEEAGAERVPGQADSAPHAPMIWRKLLLTTLISALLFALFYANLVNGWIGFDDVVPNFLRPDEMLRR
jgi:predicted secreted protein